MTRKDHAQAEAGEGRDDPVEGLVSAHRRFLAFLQPRVGNRADAEDLLQAAYVRAVEHEEDLREVEDSVAWFFRLLRNALVDHYRRRDVERRARDARAAELPDHADLDPALRRTVCRCIEDLLPSLSRSYAEIVREVDLEQVPLAEVAERRRITATNARVTLHRARRALRRQLEISCGTCAVHGCLDCSCGD
jgi:RNA polymerase sigma-70 factor (ECF subfamily)